MTAAQPSAALQDASQTASRAPSRWLLLGAFTAIYLVWGSSYVFIHFAVESIPPFLMAGARFTVAGLIMILWARMQGAPIPTLRHWRSAAIAGFPMFLINNGALVWASQTVPSGMVSLIIAITPMWMVLLDWWRPTLHGRMAGGVRPTWTVFAGLVLGLGGILLLASPGATMTGGEANSRDISIGVLVILIGTVGWAAGSMYARHAEQPASPILATGMQLLLGGIMLLVLGVVTGEAARLELAHIKPLAIFSWAYLVIMGSIIGFGSYVWLLRVASPARVATYAYINPVVGVILGWALAGETISERTILATAIIIVAVMIVNDVRFHMLRLLRPRALRTAMAEPVAESV